GWWTGCGQRCGRPNPAWGSCPPDSSTLSPAPLGTDRRSDAWRGRPRPDGNRAELLGGDRADRHLVADLRGLVADSPDLYERHDPVATAGHDPLVRFTDGFGGRRLGPAGTWSLCRRVGIRPVIRRRSSDLDHRPTGPRPLAASERAGGHGSSGCV